MPALPRMQSPDVNPGILPQYSLARWRMAPAILRRFPARYDFMRDAASCPAARLRVALARQIVQRPRYDARRMRAWTQRDAEPVCDLPSCQWLAGLEQAQVNVPHYCHDAA